MSPNKLRKYQAKIVIEDYRKKYHCMRKKWRNKKCDGKYIQKGRNIIFKGVTPIRIKDIKEREIITRKKT